MTLADGVSVAMDLDANIDESLITQVKELEFVFSKEFLGWFLGVEMTQYLQARAKQRFDAEGDLGGEKGWKNLSEFTVNERTSLGFPGRHPINKRTGDMEDWVTTADSRLFGDAAEMILEWPGSMPEGEMFDKIETAQRGKKDPKFVPARPVIRFSEVDYTYLMAKFAMHMKPGGVKFDGN